MHHPLRVTITRRVTIADGPPRHRAFPALAKRSTGELLVAFREGTDHWRTIDGCVRLTRSSDGGDTWSEPVTVYEEPGVRSGCHHGLAPLRDGTLILPFTRIMEFQPHRQEIWITKSTDGGRHWTEPEQLGPQPGWMWQNQYGRVLEPEPGTVFVSGSGEIEGQAGWRTGYFVSRDGGQTWTDRVTVAVGLQDEMDLGRLPDGRYLAMIRDGANTKRLWKSFSGHPLDSWSPLESTPIYGNCPALLVLPDGLVLVFHRQVRPGAAPGMALSYSRDLGLTWHEGPALYTGPNWDCSYPSPVLLDSGEIFCAYYTSFVDGNCAIEGVGFQIAGGGG